MREIFYTDAEIQDAYHAWAPRLRDYAASCRRERPLPEEDALTFAQREQRRILSAVLKQFREAPNFSRRLHLQIVHGSLITLLAAQEVFENSEAVVPLLSAEWERLLPEITQGADGWYGSNWVTIHAPVPPCFRSFLHDTFPEPPGVELWVLTQARYGNATHDLWRWNGAVATFVMTLAQQYTEEGFIDKFTDWPAG